VNRRKRRHSNTDARRQIRRGRTREQVARIARRLGIPLWDSKRREHQR
jgi:hypothetical protein